MSETKHTHERAISNPLHPANGRVPTEQEVRELPVGGVLYYRGSVIERVEPHALRVDGEIKNHPKCAIDYAIHNSSIGSMSNCYKKYISALEALLAEGSAFDDMLAALKAFSLFSAMIGKDSRPSWFTDDDAWTAYVQADELRIAAIAKAGTQ